MPQASSFFTNPSLSEDLRCLQELVDDVPQTCMIHDELEGAAISSLTLQLQIQQGDRQSYLA